VLAVHLAVAGGRRKYDTRHSAPSAQSWSHAATDWQPTPDHNEGTTTMQIDAHDIGREERRALLEQRRSAVANQLRRLAIELTDIDRQLDEFEQSEGQGTPSDITEGMDK
jgi:hypothetical protein